MKLPKLLVVVIAILSFAGCGYQPKTKVGKDMAAWWGAPSTQRTLDYVQTAATQFAINAGLAALQQWAGGGKIDYQKIAVQGGISTLYQQASNIRQLQGTAQVLDPNATAKLLEQGGTPEHISRKLAEQLFNNATALIIAGATANEAAEVNASGLDAAAALLETKTLP